MKDQPDNAVNFIFKRRILQEMTERTKQVLDRGLKDEKVCHELIISEFNSKKVLSDYRHYIDGIKDKKIIKYSPAAAALAILASVVVFLAIGLFTDVWHPTWLIVEGTASLSAVALMWTGVYLLNRHKMLYAVSRALVAGSVMVITQFLFLVLRIPLGIEKAYLIFLAALALMFISDAVLATLTGQRLIIINYLITVPVVFVFIYVIFGILRFYTWQQGEVLIYLSLLIDVLIVVGMLLHNRKYTHKPEVDDVWKEN